MVASKEHNREGFLQISRLRFLLVHALITFLIGGSLFDTLNRKEHWPLSSYPMFSAAKRDPSSVTWRLFGVTGVGEMGREIPLFDFQYIQPFDQIRLSFAFSRMAYDPNHQQLLSEALRNCLLRYEALRRAGRHDGPPLRVIRLYRLQWQLDPWAINVDSPSYRKLIAEEKLSDGSF